MTERKLSTTAEVLQVIFPIMYDFDANHIGDEDMKAEEWGFFLYAIAVAIDTKCRLHTVREDGDVIAAIKDGFNMRGAIKGAIEKGITW
ncbi:MAG TPA: hypothetical protein VH593_01845 [Ktedonobacteraceae bacterium]